MLLYYLYAIYHTLLSIYIERECIVSMVPSNHTYSLYSSQKVVCGIAIGSVVLVIIEQSLIHRETTPRGRIQNKNQEDNGWEEFY